MKSKYRRLKDTSTSRSSDESTSDSALNASENELDDITPLHKVEGESEDELLKQSHGSRPRLRPTATAGNAENNVYNAPQYKRRKSLAKLGRWLIPKRLCFIVLSVLVGALVLIEILVLLLGSHYKESYKKATLDGDSPPWYPTPRGGTTKRWEESYRKAAKMVSEMSLLEKVNITTGTGWMMGLCVGNTGPATAVGFPSLCLQDGPLGLRFVDNITASPAGITVGATWNKDLMYKRGKMLGLESRMKGINVILGPSVGPLGRLPAGGRNWEGFGVDPVLQGIAASETVRGIQEEGVMATIKHFIGNEQEHFRRPDEWGVPFAISSNIDDRTLHELYAWPFADAIRAGVASVMCAYNQVNNSYACQNSKLLNGILKDELAFQGFVQSDWLGQRSGVASALAGLDMSMPGDGANWADGQSFWGPHLTLAALNRTLPMDRFNDMVMRIVAAWYQLGQDHDRLWAPATAEAPRVPKFSSWTKDAIGLLRPGSDDTTKGTVNHYVSANTAGDFSHSALARRIAAEGIVLLKNMDNILPLHPKGISQSRNTLENPTPIRKRRIAIVGEDARGAEGGPNVCADRGCNKGTLASGWGSGAVDFPYLITPLEALEQGFHAENVDLTVFPENTPPSQYNATVLSQQDICIVFANSDGGEGYLSDDGIYGDRNDLRLQKGGEELIQDVAAHCGSQRSDVNYIGETIVVLHTIGPVIMESFIENVNVRAVLLANLPGQESGNALADVMFGYVNPSGHLPYTIAKSLSDYGPDAEVLYQVDNATPQQDFSEGLLVDYRWIDAMKITPRYEFGYGLSYTTFFLEHLAVSPTIGDRPDPFPARRAADDCSAPDLDSSLRSADDAVFPQGWRKLKKYIYPYIDSVRDVKMGPYPYPEILPQQLYSHAGGGEGGNPSLWDTLVNIHVTVGNAGERDGQAVVQLYVVFPQDVYEEVLEDERVGVQDENLSKRDWDEYENAKYRQGEASNTAGSQTTEEPLSPVEMMSTTPSYNWDEIYDDPSQEEGSDEMEVGSSAITEFFDGADVSNTPFPSSPLSSTPPSSRAAPPEATAGPPTSSYLHAFIKSEKITFPPRVLRAFQKVHLHGVAVDSTSFPNSLLSSSSQLITPSFKEGNKRVIEFNLTRRDLSYWSVRRQNWIIPEGTFGIEVGFSSRDLRVRSRVF